MTKKGKQQTILKPLSYRYLMIVYTFGIGMKDHQSYVAYLILEVVFVHLLSNVAMILSCLPSW
jgi:hypothetical protein